MVIIIFTQPHHFTCACTSSCWAALLLYGRHACLLYQVTHGKSTMLFGTWNVLCRKSIGVTKKLLVVKSYPDLGMLSPTGYQRPALSTTWAKNIKDAYHASHLIACIYFFFLLIMDYLTMQRNQVCSLLLPIKSIYHYWCGWVTARVVKLTSFQFFHRNHASGYQHFGYCKIT